jgi:phospholipase/carboxylesterase
MSDSHLAAVEIRPRDVHRSTLIWLHGLGADGHDFEPIAKELGLPENLGVRFIFPHGPYRAITINGGYRMRAWYDIVRQDLSLFPDEAGILESRRSVSEVIAREIQCGVSPSRIILAGFSQGGVIALDTAAHYSHTLGGVIALSAYVAMPEHMPQASHSLPIFMAHGTQDPVVPHELGSSSCALLKAKGYDVEWHRYPIQHSVCREEITAIRDWLLRQLGED